MKKLDANKEVLKFCPNFDRIINLDYYEDDVITGKLIQIYEKFIFSSNIEDETDAYLIKEIDKVLGKYIDDYMFRKELQREIFKVKIRKTCSNIIKAIVESIIGIFEKYQEETTRKIYISRWI